MTLVLVHLICGSCSAQLWSIAPFDALTDPFQCIGCDEMTMAPAIGVPLHILPATSYLIFTWYESYPEALVVDPPEQDLGRPCRR
jgi:hypothetical protein